MKFKWSWRGFYFMGESRKHDQIIIFKHSFSQHFTYRTRELDDLERRYRVLYVRIDITIFLDTFVTGIFHCCFFKTSVLISAYYKELKARRKEHPSLNMEVKFCWYFIVSSFYFLRFHLSSLEKIITVFFILISPVAIFVLLINTYVLSRSYTCTMPVSKILCTMTKGCRGLFTSIASAPVQCIFIFYLTGRSNRVFACILCWY
jgi:hypothetical protein